MTAQSLPALQAGPTALERLDQALTRMVEKHGFCPVTRPDETFPEPVSALLLTEDPLRNPEVLDACVILPEALKPLGDTVHRRVAGPTVSPALMQRFGVTRPPAVAFLRQGQLLGVLQGIRDWQAYRHEVARLLAVGPGEISLPAAPNRLAAIPVQVVRGGDSKTGEQTQGACA